MSNNKQSSVDYLISQLQKSKDWNRVLNEVSQMSSARVDIINQAKSTHETESIDFALYAMMAESFNDLPEATKQYLREKVRKEYNKFFGHPTGRVLFAKMCEAVDKIKLEL